MRAPSGGEHSPACTVLFGVGGPLENHQCSTVISMQPAAIVATAGKRARRRLVGAPEIRARSRVNFMDAWEVKVTNENGFLASNMIIKAKSTIMQEWIWINRAARSGHQRPVASNSTSDMSLMECSHCGNLLLTLFENFQKRLQLRKN